MSEGAQALAGRTVALCNPSPDVYGADLQLLESVTAVVGAGGRAVVVLPEDGPLVQLAEQRGAEVVLLAFPVLRRATQSGGALVSLAFPLPSAFMT